MTLRQRGQFAEPKDTILLTVSYKDNTGAFVDTDTLPSITLITPSNMVMLGPTTAGVAHDAVGRYSYVYQVPYNPPFGIYNDVWQATINSSFTETKGSFIVNYSQVPTAANSDGYLALGDIPGFDYSQTAIANIGKLLKILKQRLNSSGKTQSVDQYGNKIYIDCDVFSVETLVTFLGASLSDFNQVPYFTNFTFDDSVFVSQFAEILVEGAALYSMLSISLIEKGRSIKVSDNGINVDLPDLGDFINSQYSSIRSQYYEKLKYIKNSLRLSPISLGLFSMNSGGYNTAIRRLRHLRSRRII